LDYSSLVRSLRIYESHLKCHTESLLTITAITSSDRFFFGSLARCSLIVQSSVRHLDLVLQPTVITQLLEALQRLVQRDQLALLLRGGVVAVADVDRAAFLLFGADD
jgi:hypothetical protein